MCCHLETARFSLTATSDDHKLSKLVRTGPRRSADAAFVQPVGRTEPLVVWRAVAEGVAESFQLALARGLVDSIIESRAWCAQINGIPCTTLATRTLRLPRGGGVKTRAGQHNGQGST